MSEEVDAKEDQKHLSLKENKNRTMFLATA